MMEGNWRGNDWYRHFQTQNLLARFAPRQRVKDFCWVTGLYEMNSPRFFVVGKPEERFKRSTMILLETNMSAHGSSKSLGF